jgi:hypothetical protein
MDELQRHCIYCQLIYKDQDDQSVHLYKDCRTAEEAGSGIRLYKQWRGQIQLASRGQCFRCGLGEEVYKAVEEERGCDYFGLMHPGIFILYMNITLLPICKGLGFLGRYENGRGGGSSRGEQWQWLNQVEDRWIDHRREIG